MLSRVTSRLPADVDALVYRIIGCGLEVHNALGPGFVESVYHRAMKIESRHQGLEFKTEHLVNVSCRGEVLMGHRVDLLVEDQVIVELKAVARLEPIHTSQVVSYLRATGLRAGLLMNFNSQWLRGSIKRVVV
jgi:GxxExxY protein